MAWLLCIAAGCGVAVSAWQMYGYGFFPSEDYAESMALEAQLYGYMDEVSAAYHQPTEAQVNTAVNSYVSGLYEKRALELEGILSVENVDGAPYEGVQGEVAEDGGDTDSGLPQSVLDSLSEYGRQRVAEVQERYDGLIADARQVVEQDLQKQREVASQKVNGQNAYFYAALAQDGAALADNTDSDTPLQAVAALPGAGMAMLDSDGSIYAATVPVDVAGAEAMRQAGSSGTALMVAVALQPEAYAAQSAAYAVQADSYTVSLTWLLVGIGVLVGAFVWLMFITGRNTDGTARLYAIDRLVYLDIGFVLMLAVLVGCFILAGVMGFSIADSGGGDPLSIFVMLLPVGSGMGALLVWATSLARRSKTGTAEEFTLAGRMAAGLRRAYRSADVKARTVVLCILYILVGLLFSAVFVYGLVWYETGFTLVGLALVAVYAAFSLWYLIRHAVGVQRAKDGLEEIGRGNMEYVIPGTGDHDMNAIIDGVNRITEGLSDAVRKEVKAERMRTELITNISHDLKTPLTSILTYVDLMKKEELPADAQKYLEVLDMKSMRLKVLTDDLFEAAKAQSGDMTVNLSDIEPAQFMEQAMGELSDRMDASGLRFITELPEERLHVLADGRMLFRVVSNVIDNAIKYSIPGSRVYIGMERDGGEVCVTFKNVSREELNISEDELMERFVRGDSSRNTEGSGLGLAIAKSFMQLMGGRFSIEIDGDLFKARVCLPLAAEAEAAGGMAGDEPNG